MTSRTDDDLDRMLRATFAAHEHLADPDRARALAHEVTSGGAVPSRATSVRRRWIVGLAAASVVALGAGGAAVWSGRHTAGAVASGSATSATAPSEWDREQAAAAAERAGREADREAAAAQTARNRAAASAEVHRLISLAPQVPGATATRARSGGDDLATYFTNQVGADRWFAVPATPAATLAYLRAHPPAGLTLAEQDPQWNDYPAGRLIALRYVADATSALTAPQLDLSIIETPTGGVLYRVQAATSWRPANPFASLVGGVTEVSYSIVRPVDSTMSSSYTVARGVLRDPAAISSLTTAIAALPGQPQYVGHCPFQGYSDDVFVFTTGTGASVTVDAHLTCPEAVIVTIGHDGSSLQLADPQALDTLWQSLARK